MKMANKSHVLRIISDLSTSMQREIDIYYKEEQAIYKKLMQMKNDSNVGTIAYLNMERKWWIVTGKINGAIEMKRQIMKCLDEVE